MMKLSEEAEILLEQIKLCGGGAEVEKSDWGVAQELQQSGLVELSGPRGPAKCWIRATLKEEK